MTANSAPLDLAPRPPVPLTGTNTKTVIAPRDFPNWLAELRAQEDVLAPAGFFVLVPTLMLSMTRDALRGTGIAYGSQDCAAEPEGITGETPAAHLAEFGCAYAMIGHHQRRQSLEEDDNTAARKATRAAEAGLTPVLCTGETERGTPADAAETVTAQVRPVLEQVPVAVPLVVLYEPLWASREHRAADAEHVAVVQRVLDALSTGRPGPVRILYGGAVAPGTWQAMRQGTGLDGLALGRAGIDATARRTVIEEILADPPARAEAAHARLS
ncbi:triose-phosphate isomerase [Streptomyces sp. NPDC092903]|uniref:triose-phosphate isomerase n=1 Tax=Streptomyces sp. NPDC092903 TaxID=3366017 RepID=UPI003802B472